MLHSDWCPSHCIIMLLMLHSQHVKDIRRHNWRYFMPPPPINAAEACFRVVRPWVRLCVRPGVRPVSTVTPKRVEGFWPNLTQKYSTPRLDELIAFWRSWGQGQGRYKVKCLSELLQRAEASTSTLGHRSIIYFILVL